MTFVPVFFDDTGDAVNERQLITALASKVEKCYLVTFFSLKQGLTKKGRSKLSRNLPKNVTPLLVPILPINSLIMYFSMNLTSCLIGLIGLITGELQKIDLIYVRNSFLSMGFLTFPSLAKKTIIKIPAIAEEEINEDIVTKFFISYFASVMDRLVLSKAARIGVNGESLYNKLVARRGLSHKYKPIEITPGVNLNLIKTITHIHNEHLDAVNIGFIGSLSWWQGVDILIEAIRLLSKKVPAIKLVIIGDGSCKQLLEERCKSLDLSYEITGFLSHEEALKRLSMLDIFVLSSRRVTVRETIIPIKIMEAWALGIPVIVTKHQVFVDNHIKNLEDVIFCEPEPPSVFNAITLLLNNSEIRNKLVINGPKIAKKFDYNEIAEKLLEGIYE